MKKILSMILLLCAAFSAQLRAEEFTESNPVYIQGKAANADWGLTSALVKPMTYAGNGVYTWTGDLAVNTFRFLCELDETGKNWNLMSWEAEANDTEVSSGHIYKVKYQRHNYDYNFKVTEAGNYRLILDTQQYKLIVQKTDDTTIYAIGDDFGNWTQGQAVALTEGADLKYTCSSYLNADKNFRFTLKNDGEIWNENCRIASAWSGNEVLVNSAGVGVDSHGDTFYYSGTEGNWHVTEAGYYTLTLDLVARKLSVTYTPATINAVAEAGSSEYYATFSSSYGNMALTGTDLKIYDVTVDGNKLNLTQHTGNLVAQGEGVLVKASAAEITVAPTNEEVTADVYGTSTLLVATPGIKQEVTPDGEYKLYRLTYNKPSTHEGLGFFSTTSGNIQAQPGKAYLKVQTTQSASLKGFLINPQPTGVEAIGVDADCDNTIYDLNGRRVENPSNGIYIQNGKKIFVK